MTRTPLILALVAGTLTLGACGGDSGSPASTTSRDDQAFEGALKYAKCMRDHGVDMPDPTRDSNGGVRMTVHGWPGSAGRDDATMQAAQKACEKLQDLGGGTAPDPATQARMQDAFLAYAKCMRKEGVDMPDPTFDGGKVTMRVGRGQGGKRTGPNPDAPAFKAADRTCHRLLADVEREGHGT